MRNVFQSNLYYSAYVIIRCAGREWREAVMSALEFHDALDATARLADRAADLAGRGEAWLLASASDSQFEPSLNRNAASVTLDRSDVLQAIAYRGARGHWLAASPGTNDVIEWHPTNAVSQTVLSVVQLSANGTSRRLEWTLSNPPTNTCFRYLPLVNAVARG